MKSSVLKFPLFFFLLVVLTAQILVAEVPTSIEKVPIYKGMKLISEEKMPKEIGLISGTRRVYRANIAIEEIVQFYEKEFGITKRFEDPEDQNNLDIGKYVKPTIQVYFYDDSQFIDGNFGEGGTSKRGWIKKELVKRKKDKENAWIESANSEWYFRNSKSTMSTLHIMFQDLSIDEENLKYELNTEIIIEVTHYEYEI